MWRLIEPKELIEVGDYFESGMGDKVRWTKYDKGMSAVGKPCGELRIVRRKITTNKQSESLKCHCGSDLPTLCNACFISEGFQNAQGSL